MPTPSSEAVRGSGTRPTALPPLKPAVPKSVRPLPLLKALQLLEMVLVSIVTAPVNANALPHRIVALLSRVMLSAARIFPANDVLAPRVADPLCATGPTPSNQYTPT